MKSKFEIDWVKLWLDNGSFILKDSWRPGYQGHIKTLIKKDRSLSIQCSGRVVKTPTFLGGITLDNFDIFHEEILNTGVIVSKDELLNAQVSQLDVKKDVHFKSTNLSHAISMLRERAIPSTNKYHIITYDKPLGVIDSLLIKTTTKSTTDSLAIYKKLAEMKANRKNDYGYFNSFDYEFLDSCKDILRFERRLKGAKKLRQALHLPKKTKVTLNVVLNSPYNILQEKIEEHLNLSETGGNEQC